MGAGDAVAPIASSAMPISSRFLIRAAVSTAALAALSAPALGAVEGGIYQDNPVRDLPTLARATAPPEALSTYVTGGKLVDPKVVKLAKKRKMRLVISWMPDAGKKGVSQKPFGSRAVLRGKYDKSLRLLTKQVRGLQPAPILRLMPEMNTPWYAWSGTVKGNDAGKYVAAWQRARAIVQKSGGKNIQFLWAPYARNIPEIPTNTFAAYFPGADQVDLIGASGYNFGAAAGLAWTTPRALFADAYRELRALAPKPFWIAETGSTGVGGDKAAWISQLTTLPQAFPDLQGVVWYDVKEPNGDFRVRESPTTARAFADFVRG
jgi:hypothetical protein